MTGAQLTEQGPHHGGARRVRLQVPLAATPAQAPADVDHEVTDLPGRVGGPTIQLPIAHDRTTDPCAHKDAQKVSAALARAEALLASRGDLHVIAHGDGFFKAF